jgi:hypothetical protein
MLKDQLKYAAAELSEMAALYHCLDGRHYAVIWLRRRAGHNTAQRG